MCVSDIINKPHPERMYHYKKIDDTLDWSMLKFPIMLSDIDKCEKKNNISVNVVGMNDKGAYVPLRKTKITNAIKDIDLLLINDGDKKWHYVVIKDFNKLVGSQYSKYEHKTHICRTCFHGFSSSELLKNHTDNGCVQMLGSQIVLPEKGEVMRFENHNKKFRHPFVIYADFESTNLPTNDDNKRAHKANNYGFLCAI